MHVAVQPQSGAFHLETFLLCHEWNIFFNQDFKLETTSTTNYLLSLLCTSLLGRAVKFFFFLLPLQLPPSRLCTCWGCCEGYKEQRKEWQPPLSLELNEGLHKWCPSPPVTLESHTEWRVVTNHPLSISTPSISISLGLHHGAEVIICLPSNQRQVTNQDLPPISWGEHIPTLPSILPICSWTNKDWKWSCWLDTAHIIITGRPGTVLSSW